MVGLSLVLGCLSTWSLSVFGQADAPARQVTLFGVIATPHDLQIDPKLARVAPQLRKLLPNHGFRLLGVQSKRLTASQSLSCPLPPGQPRQGDHRRLALIERGGNPRPERDPLRF